MAKNKNTLLMLSFVFMIICGGLASAALTAPTGVVPADGTKYLNGQSSVVINATATAADNITSCKLTWVDATPTGVAIDTMTGSATTCTLTVSNIPDGTYKFNVISVNASAESAASATTTITMNNKESSPAAYLYAIETEDGEDTNGGRNIAIIVLLGLAITYAVTRKRK